VTAVAIVSGWAVACALALVVWKLDQKIIKLEVTRPVQTFEDEPVVEADGLPIYRVEQTTTDPRRARIMFERGTPGPNEHLTLYDGRQMRGQKHGA